MGQIIISGITKEELISEIIEKLQAILPSSQEYEREEYLTCQEVQDLLKISHQTRIEWTNQGLLKAYKMRRRTYYKSSEILASLTPTKKLL